MNFRWWLLFAPAPAVLLGVFVMAKTGVHAKLYLQNVAVWLVATVVSGIFIYRAQGGKTMNRAGGWLPIGCLVWIGLTFCFREIQGVHRWIGFGGLRLHAASMALPILLIGLGTHAYDRFTIAYFGSTVIALGLLLMQPDAGQATAFAAALGIQLAPRRRGRAYNFLGLAALLGVVVVAWLRPDPLPPVPHVEGIVGLAGNLGIQYSLAAVSFLGLIPLPFLAAMLCSSQGRNRLVAASLTVYFAASLIVPFIGNFPVPLMGYGMSPLLDYFAALTWLLSREHRP